MWRGQTAQLIHVTPLFSSSAKRVYSLGTTQHGLSNNNTTLFFQVLTVNLCKTNTNCPRKRHIFDKTETSPLRNKKEVLSFVFVSCFFYLQHQSLHSKCQQDMYNGGCSQTADSFGKQCHLAILQCKQRCLSLLFSGGFSCCDPVQKIKK